MMRNQLPYNPVFESLSAQASKYSKTHTFEIFEADGDMPADKVQKYLNQIIQTLQNNVFKFLLYNPIDVVRAEDVKKMMENIEKLKKNQSIEDLFKSLNTMWTNSKKNTLDVLSTGTNPALPAWAKNKAIADKIVKMFDLIQEGMDNVNMAYENLKKAAGNKISDPALLSYVNSEMESIMVKAQSDLEKYKQQMASA